MTSEVWDYIFFDEAKIPSNSNISVDLMNKMKREFKFWYPLDLRVSGIDELKLNNKIKFELSQLEILYIL